MQRHINHLRTEHHFFRSEIIVMVERNLGFESEHHERALNGIPFVRHRVDHQAKRFGILTTEEIKYAMMTLFNNMMRDQRVNLASPLFSEDPEGNRRRLKEQLAIYSFQFKSAVNTFGKQRVSLNGKVGGMKDDVCIALQLAVYFSAQEHLYVCSKMST